MKNYNIDLHCDLLYYLLRPGTRIDDREIGCSLPFLKEGNVMLQVMALYTATAKGVGEGLKQSEIFAELTRQEGFYLFDKEALNNPESQKEWALLHHWKMLLTSVKKIWTWMKASKP